MFYQFLIINLHLFFSSLLFSCVEIPHIAKLIDLPHEQVSLVRQSGNNLDGFLCHLACHLIINFLLSKLTLIIY